MAELPKGWATAAIDHVATIVRGITFAASDKSTPDTPGTIPCLRTTNVQETLETHDLIWVDRSFVRREEQWLQRGDTMISLANSYALVGKVALNQGQDQPMSFGGFIAAIRSAGMDAKYLFYALKSPRVRSAITKTASHTVNISNISSRGLRSIEVCIAPLPEQRRIVAAIEQHFSRLDAAVATLERVKAKLGQTRASVLKAAVEGRLVPTEAALAREEGRDYEHASVLLERILAERRKKHDEAQVGAGRKKKYTEPVEPDVEGLPALPEGWVWATMMQVVQGGRPICYGVLKAGPHHPGGVPLVRVTDVVRGDLSVKLLKHCNPEREAVFARARLATGDLVVSKDGTIGRVAVVPPALDGANVTQHVLRVAVQQVADAYYVMTALRSPRAQAWMKGETKGVALQGVNVGDFRRLPIPIPPLAEQRRIVAEVDRQLSVLDEVGRVVDTNLARCARLRQSILKRAFEGRLVPQDPDDEPASALLDRIKAQVAATPKQTTRRRKSRKGTA